MICEFDAFNENIKQNHDSFKSFAYSSTWYLFCFENIILLFVSFC